MYALTQNRIDEARHDSYRNESAFKESAIESENVNANESASKDAIVRSKATIYPTAKCKYNCK